MIGVVRLCVRCKRWMSIDYYGGGAKVCNPCMYQSYYGGQIGRRGALSRSIVITESGRELLEQWRREEMGVA